MKYKVGDKVRLREWDDMAKKYPVVDGVIKMGYSFCVPMKKFCGTTVTIDFVGEGYYEIKEDGRCWCWTDEMFEDVEQPNIKHWREIAGWYGLEIDEEFDIEDALYNPYKFTEKGLVDCNGDTNTIWLDCIINDQCIITKRPWKPKDGDTYYYIRPIDGSIVESEILDYYLFDLAMLKNGWIFKTREEAEVNKERILREYEEVLK